MILSFKGLVTQIADILPFITVSKSVLCQGTSVVERFVTRGTH